GEYGGAATYVAEHAPAGRRGFYTSFIQTTATLGLFLSLGVILLTRYALDINAFNNWGWRIPFLLSAFLVVVSIIIRLRMHESPLFAKIKAEGKIVSNPLKESFGKKENLKMVLLALFGATAGQGVVWYTGQFYALSFIQKTMHVEFVQSNYVIAIALLIGTPFFVIFGGWSDKIGRRNIMLAGMLLGVIFYRPLYQQMYALSDMSLKVERQDLKTLRNETQVENDGRVNIRTVSRMYTDGTELRETTTSVESLSGEAGKPATVTELVLPGKSFWILIFLIAVQVIFVTMVYGPIAAFLVELFPTNIRYTSMSLPYHIGNGVFGGLTPFIATSLTSLPGATPFDGLWYPIGVAALCLIIGFIYIKKKTDVQFND
ncbi:MFS transporter, partial [Pararcticibacter amylolyticus]|uniref:MFS transporter n=1 Tax=Pararcticibacter amylolyticus TaxID=2173175 RepID=UPI001EE3BADF